MNEAPTGEPRHDGTGHILSYHCISKHHLHQYAEGPGFLDWANQPEPFRTYAGAPAVDLPLLADASVADFAGRGTLEAAFLGAINAVNAARRDNGKSGE